MGLRRLKMAALVLGLGVAGCGSSEELAPPAKVPASGAASTRAGTMRAATGGVTTKVSTLPGTGAAATSPAATMSESAMVTTAPAVMTMPAGKNWIIRIPAQGMQFTVLVPDGWEKREPTESNAPTIYKPGAVKNTDRAAWNFNIVQTKRAKPEMVMDRTISGRTAKMTNFEIREQKTFTLPDGKDAATLLFTTKDDKGVLMACRETYYWVDDDHLLITYQWAQASAWRECRGDMEAMSMSVKLSSIPVEKAPAETGPK